MSLLLFSDITIDRCFSPHLFLENGRKNVPLDDADDASCLLSILLLAAKDVVAPFLIEQSSTDSFPADGTGVY